MEGLIFEVVHYSTVDLWFNLEKFVRKLFGNFRSAILYGLNILKTQEISFREGRIFMLLQVTCTFPIKKTVFSLNIAHVILHDHLT